MRTHEFLPSELQAALDQFSRTHQGWRAVLEETEPAEERGEIRDLPLVGMSADDHDGENQVVIMLGDQPDRHFTHIVAQPAKVRIGEDVAGSEAMVEIEAEDGGRTVVRLYANTSASSAG